uniref:Uncharacterized protein n=1 Tax=Nelumbo nucifera TaxID=4432 RepID=A0A822YAN7_NELNU|nr:TPA_asm: hypothetical protein HUJ06_029624 [Nelumbo nucifera]
MSIPFLCGVGKRPSELLFLFCNARVAISRKTSFIPVPSFAEVTKSFAPINVA